MQHDDLFALEAHLKFRLAQPLPGAAAQWQFAPHPARKDWRPDDRPSAARQAAALILIYPGSEGPSIVLTERHHDLPHHPGQISLPGGGLDPDEDPEQGALREAHEEIGLRPRDVRVIGALSTLWVVVSNFVVHPIVGVADERPEFRAEPREVAALIEAPVTAIASNANVRTEQGALREAHEEIGLRPRDVRVIGALSTLWVVVSNFVVHPIVGVADERPEFRAEPREVAALIEAPVTAIASNANVRTEQRVRDGILIRYPYFDIDGHHIWGATAMMLGEFRAILDYGSSSRP